MSDEELVEQAADGSVDPAAWDALLADPARVAAAIDQVRERLVLSVALDPEAGRRTAERVSLALAASTASARQRTVAAVRRHTRPRIWPWALAAVAALVVVGFGWWGRDVPPPATVPESAGLRLADGSVITVLSGTANVDVQGRVVLPEGEIDVAAVPQVPGRPLVLTTPEAEAVVVGTRFRLASRAGRTELRVAEGTVLLRRAGVEVSVGAGQAAWARAQWPSLLPGLPPAELVFLRQHDYEDGVVPLRWLGRIAACPPGRPGLGLHGIRYSERFGLFGVAYDNWDDPEADTVRYVAGMRLQGWIFVTGTLRDLALRSGDSDRRLDFGLALDLPRATWIQLDVPLALLRGERGEQLKAGCRMADLRLQCRDQPDQTLVVDDLALVIPAASAP